MDNRTSTVLQVTCRVEYDIATQRALEISVIQHIKELGAKLGGLPFRNSCVFIHRKVQIRQPRTRQYVTSRVSQQIDACGERYRRLAVLVIESWAWSCRRSPPVVVALTRVARLLAVSPLIKNMSCWIKERRWVLPSVVAMDFSPSPRRRIHQGRAVVHPGRARPRRARAAAQGPGAGAVEPVPARRARGGRTRSGSGRAVVRA